MRKLFVYLGFVTAAISMASCKKGFQKTEGGLEYMIYTNNSGPKPKEGEIMRCDIIYKKVKNDSDSVFFSSITRDTGAVVKLSKPTCKGCIEEGMMMLSAGDSATFIASADSFFLKTIGQELPPFFKKGDKIKFEVKMHSIMTEEQRAAMLKNAEDKKLKDFITSNGITVPARPSGLYYVETLTGTGASPVEGDSVRTNYVGKFLDGRVFDQSSNGGGPITFVMGQMQVIPGWEEGFLLMKEGGKANFIIPSSLAYGTTGYPPVIPPSTPLMFEVELVKVIKAKNAVATK